MTHKRSFVKFAPKSSRTTMPVVRGGRPLGSGRRRLRPHVLRRARVALIVLGGGLLLFGLLVVYLVQPAPK